MSNSGIAVSCLGMVAIDLPVSEIYPASSNR